ncbi:hypothetical protein B0H17DRAFT_595144 [Mycena rosella]|uniref:F-box domain-containing protein n=1 Tax=Mycena rosella TaxID=1033263 RepID=A0AAD7DFF0_MYCRO|nr:hypothetical protein B0H17DRAFT_595144 [Mycena rosella]
MSIFLATEPPPPSLIPPEIVDAVIDHLASNPRTLRKCCLVARSWLPRSRSHLFRRIAIPTSRLRPFLARCTIFGPVVRSLVFHASDAQFRRHRVNLLCESAARGEFASYASLASLEIRGM